MRYNQLYALPRDRWEWSRDKNDGGNGFERFKISEAEAQAKADDGFKIACRIGDEDFVCVDVDAHDGKTEGLDTLEDWRTTYPEFDKTYSEKSKSGGFHYYFNKLDTPLLKTAFPSIDLMNQHDLWVIVAPTKGYTVHNDADTLQELPEDLRVISRTYENDGGDRGLDMPPLVQPKGAGATILRQNPELEATDWNSVGGRNQALFDACVKIFHKASGTPEERMGKALYVVDEWLDEIQVAADRHFTSIEAWWDFNRGLSAILDKAIDDANNPAPPNNGGGNATGGGGGGGNAGGGAAGIIQFVLDNYDLGVTGANKTFVVPKNGLKRPITLPASGGRFKNKLAADLYTQRNQTPGRLNLEAAIGVIVGIAAEQEPTEFDLRVARRGDTLVIDMDEPTTTRCIVVTPEGWHVADEPPAGVLFTKANGAYPLPEPERDGSLDELRTVLNMADDYNWHLIEGWMVASAFPDLPRPLLGLFGTPGSAKTTRGTFCVSVLDPRLELGGAIGKGKDASTTALNNFFVGYDNEKEKVTEETSDFVSRLVTGSAIAQRALYTDAELFYESYKRTGVISAVSVPGFKADTLERIIQVHLDPITESERTTLTAVREAFESAHPRILGALCDALVKVLRTMPTLAPAKDKPRMSDYYEVVRAYSPRCAEAFYRASRDALVDAAQDNQFVGVLVEYLNSKPDTFNVTPAEAFKDCLYIANGHDDVTWFPKGSNTFSGQVMLNATSLSMLGWNVKKVRSNGQRLFEFTRNSDDTSDDTPEDRHYFGTTVPETVTVLEPDEVQMQASDQPERESVPENGPDSDDSDDTFEGSFLNPVEEEKEEEGSSKKAVEEPSLASLPADWATTTDAEWFS